MSLKKLFLLITVLFCLGAAYRFEIISALSPKNSKRTSLKQNRFIILHTTEGGAIGSLEKLRRYGEAHYMVDRNGSIYKIIENDRVARHSGRSQWGRYKSMDNYSIGIEVVGTYSREPTRLQERALSDLLRQLRWRFDIPSENVLTHSMVAYGAPNPWHRKAHRGRKRCGMIMASDDVRRKLGLGPIPAVDPNVKSGQLAVADPYLRNFLYGTEPRTADRIVASNRTPKSNIVSAGHSAWDIAGDRYNRLETIYSLPDGRRLRGNEIQNWNSLPVGTRISFASPQIAVAAVDKDDEEIIASASPVERDQPEFEGFQTIGTNGQTAFEIAGTQYASDTTIYFLPSGIIRSGSYLAKHQEYLLNHLPASTRILSGYIYGGHITADRSATAVAGTAWNADTTFYYLPDGKVVSGDTINPRSIPARSLIFFRR